MPLPSIIAIDGPVASGKSAVGQRLADELGYLFFDTGVMYRAVTYLALRDLKSVEDEVAVTALAERAHLDLQPGPDGSRMWADGEDITSEVRSLEVEACVSPVAAIPAVRQILTAQMRRVGLRGRVVMVGRDVGTVILPEADLKIFLTASVETRAWRRFQEVQARGEARTYEEILMNLRERDRIDASRTTAPLRSAGDAITLDTTQLDLDGVVAAIERLIESHSRD
ncbi:MAG: (d)CMP kinase [Anaerolineales bacterium]